MSMFDFIEKKDIYNLIKIENLLLKEELNIEFPKPKSNFDKFTTITMKDRETLKFDEIKSLVAERNNFLKELKLIYERNNDLEKINQSLLKKIFYNENKQDPDFQSFLNKTLFINYEMLKSIIEKQEFKLNNNSIYIESIIEESNEFKLNCEKLENKLKVEREYFKNYLSMGKIADQIDAISPKKSHENSDLISQTSESYNIMDKYFSSTNPTKVKVNGKNSLGVKKNMNLKHINKQEVKFNKVTPNSAKNINLNKGFNNKSNHSILKAQNNKNLNVKQKKNENNMNKTLPNENKILSNMPSFYEEELIIENKSFCLPNEVKILNSKISKSKITIPSLEINKKPNLLSPKSKLSPKGKINMFNKK